MQPLKPPYNKLHFIKHTSFTKDSNLTNSFFAHYPQPKMNQKSPKDPKCILFLTIKLLYTYFWKTLPVGALIWLAPIWLTWAQIAQPTSNHLKTVVSIISKRKMLQNLSSFPPFWGTLCCYQKLQNDLLLQLLFCKLIHCCLPLWTGNQCRKYPLYTCQMR